MKLEDEIQQEKFKNEFQKLTINIIFTSNWLENHFRDFLKEYDITLQQFNVLRILRGKYPSPISVSDIRSRMLDKMSDVSRIVERLRQQGFADRIECLKDRRLVDISISQKGLDLLNSMDVSMDEFDQKNVEKLTEEEARQMNEYLDRLRK
jgi:DNA-binding MarR family transcriptional regulator